MTEFAVKDSGERMEFESGMVRDTDDSKTDFSLIYDGPMLERWAEHLTKGAKKYAARNWMKAAGMAEYLRFKASAARHFFQWFVGNVDEDHASAVFFNINGAEYVKAKMEDDALREFHAEADAYLAAVEAPKPVTCVLPAYKGCTPCDACRRDGRCLSPENSG